MTNANPSNLLQRNLLLEHNNPCSLDTKKDFYCAYAGPSMHPTLKSGDLLKVTAYEQNTPQVGDVILFIAPELNEPVVHRIISNTNNRFKTRGDNCSHMDPWEINQQLIRGKITGTVRGKRCHNITGSLFGRFQAFLCLTYNLLILKFFISMKKTLKPFHAHTPLSIIYFPKKHLHTIRFHNKGTPLHRLMLGTKHIGHYNTTDSRWRIRLPYRFLFKQSSLPKIL